MLCLVIKLRQIDFRLNKAITVYKCFHDQKLQRLSSSDRHAHTLHENIEWQN